MLCWLLIEAFFVPSNNVNMQLVRSSEGWNIGNYREILLRSSSNNEMSDQSIGNTSSPTLIGDITQNLHGGKYYYQFSETQYLGLQAAAWRDNNLQRAYIRVVEEDNELPKWALKLQQPEAHEGKQLSGALTFKLCCKVTYYVSEIWWKKIGTILCLYLTENLGAILPNIITTTRSFLAPRGGASLKMRWSIKCMWSF